MEARLLDQEALARLVTLLPAGTAAAAAGGAPRSAVGVCDAWLPGAASAGGATVSNALPYSPCALPTRLPFLQVTAESSCSRCWPPCCACCSARPAWLWSLRRWV